MTTQVGPNVPKVPVDPKTPPKSKGNDKGGCSRFWEIIEKYGSYIVSLPKGIHQFRKISKGKKEKNCINYTRATINTLCFGIILAPIDFINWCIKQMDDKKDPSKDKPSSTKGGGTLPAKDAVTPPAKDATPPAKDAVTPPAKDVTPPAKDPIPLTTPEATPIPTGTDVPPPPAPIPSSVEETGVPVFPPGAVVPPPAGILLPGVTPTTTEAVAK